MGGLATNEITVIGSGSAEAEAEAEAVKAASKPTASKTLPVILPADLLAYRHVIELSFFIIH